MNLENITTELTGNKALIKATAGNEDGSASDSEPSADNMDEEELA